MKIDRSGRQGKTLKERAVSHHDGSIKPQSRPRAIPGNELFDGVFVAPTGCTDASALSPVVFDWSSSGTVRLAEQLADLLGCFLGNIGGGSSTAYQSCVHTGPSAESEEFQTNSPRQEEPAVFDDRGRYHSLKSTARERSSGSRRGEDAPNFPEADLWGVRGSHRNQGVSQAGFTYRPSAGTTTGMGRASVGMFRFPQSVNCSVRRLFSI
jgi:hypothetical protein